jgi:hypothetical protein
MARAQASRVAELAVSSVLSCAANDARSAWQPPAVEMAFVEAPEKPVRRWPLG